MQDILVMICSAVVHHYSQPQQVRHRSFAGAKLQYTQMAVSQWSTNIFSVLTGENLPGTAHMMHTTSTRTSRHSRCLADKQQCRQIQDVAKQTIFKASCKAMPSLQVIMCCCFHSM